MRRCTILHQQVPPDAPPDEQDVLAAAASVARGLVADGWTVAPCAIDLDLADAAARLQATKPDLVFNLVESLGGSDVMAVAAAALLERLGLRSTGAGLAALALTADKRATRLALRDAGIMVPAAPEDGWTGRCIVKHATCHASFGLGAHSVVAAPAEVAPGWYAEAFIDGREFNISLLPDGQGVTALPAAELLFEDWPPGLPRIQDYAAKWDLDHANYARTTRSFDVAPELARGLKDIALRCWRALGLAGYARVDLRMDGDGVAYVIDVNANPCLSEDAGFAAAAARAGIDHAAMVARIAGAACPAAALPEAPTPRGRGAFRLRTELRTDDDVAALCDATGFFTPAEIAVARELTEDRRVRGPASDYRFICADLDLPLPLWEGAGGRGRAAGDSEYVALLPQPPPSRGGGIAFVGYACYGRTAGTLESWDLYWIVVHPRAQGAGVGRALVDAVLAQIAAEGGGRLYAETSSKPLYAPTRAFYASAGFALQAVVPDFYAPGDGKQIWLRLTAWPW